MDWIVLNDPRPFAADGGEFTLIGREVNKAARLEEVQRGDIIEGCKDIGDIRMSAEFRAQIGEAIQKRYAHRSVAKAKNIGELEFYS